MKDTIMGNHTPPEPEAKRGNQWNSAPEALKVITDPEHPLFNKRAIKPLTPQFIASVKRRLLQPIVCALLDGELVVVCGRRRRLAYLEINKEREANGERPLRIPYVIRTGTMAELVSMMVAENGQREQDTFLTKARNAQHAKNLDMTLEEIAEDNNVTATAVGQWLALIEKGCPELLAAVEEDRIKATPASKFLVKIDAEGKTRPATHDEQRASLAEALGDGTKRPTGKVAKAAASKSYVIPGKRVLKKLTTIKSVPKPYRDMILCLIGELPPHKVHKNLAVALRGLGWKA